jgi:hypothetical protein
MCDELMEGFCRVVSDIRALLVILSDVPPADFWADFNDLVAPDPPRKVSDPSALLLTALEDEARRLAAALVLDAPSAGDAAGVLVDGRRDRLVLKGELAVSVDTLCARLCSSLP